MNIKRIIISGIYVFIIIVILSLGFLDIWLIEHLIHNQTETSTIKRVLAWGIGATILISLLSLIHYIQAKNIKLTRNNKKLLLMAENLRVLNRITRMVTSHLDVNTILTRMADALVDKYDVAIVKVFLCAGVDPNEEGNDTELPLLLKAIAWGPEMSPVIQRPTPVEPEIMRVVRSGDKVISNDIQTNDNLDSVVWSKNTDITSFAGYPLIAQNKVIGVVAIYGRSQFGEDLLEIFDLFSQHASSSVNAAFQYEKSVEHAKSVELLNAELLSAKKELEYENNRAEEANRLKTEFLANMSHELRTPLNSIIGFSEILQDETFGELNEKQARYVGNILSSGRHLLNLINDILDLSKVEAGKMELYPEEFQVRASIEEITSIIKDSANKKNIALTVNLDEEVSTISADQKRFKQIMYNLFSNAIKFTEEGGKVDITGSIIQGKRKSDRFNLLQISITDTGIGIASEDYPKIFAEFQQVDGSHARKQEGTGLGLALTKKLVKLHGGEIWFKSKVGEGSTFAFTMPLNVSQYTDEQGVETEEVIGGRRESDKLPTSKGESHLPSILIVEDDKNASEILAHTLRQADYHPILAFDGKEAIEKAQTFQPFAITLDIMLPNMNGWQVLQALKSDAKTCDIPVIIISMVEQKGYGFSLGAADYLVKPIEKKQLIQRLAFLKAGKNETKVLLVDGDVDTLETLEGIIGPNGYTLIKAQSGKEGIAQALKHTPDLVFLNLMMPDVTGFDVIEQLRNAPTLKDVPVIILTDKDLTDGELKRLSGNIVRIAQKSSLPKIDLLRDIKQAIQLKLCTHECGRFLVLHASTGLSQNNLDC